MEEDNLPIPDDISSLEAELEFQELEKSIAEFNKGYDEPIDSRFLWNYIGGRQMGYGDDELQIIEDTAFSKIMDYMDENDLHYTEVDVYDFIPEDKRLSPYLIYKENIRNEYYTDDFVEYMTLVTRRTPSGIYDMKTDDILDAPPSHYMAEYALKGAAEQGPTVRLEVWSKIINGAVTDGFLKKLKFKDFFKKAYQRTQNRDLIIRHINNLFPGGSYEAYLEENHNRNMERMGFTPEGDWLPEIKEKMVIKYTDADGNVTYKDFYGNELDADDPRISDDSKFDDLVKQLEPSPEELTEEEKIKKLYDDNILTEREYEQALKKEGVFADTPTNVVGDADVYYHSRLGEIDNAQDIHFGTYDAALDRASLQYGKESVQSFYARALDEAYDLFREEVEALKLVDDGSGNFKLPFKSEQFNFELENKAIPPKSQEWTFEYITEGETIRLNYIADDGFETLIDEFYVETIDYEGADVKKLGDLDVEDIIGSKKGFRELEGHIQALQEGQPVDVYKGKFDFGSKYNLYKTTIKPDAKVFDMSGKDIEITELVRKRGESELSPKTNTVSSEFLQYRLFGEDAPELRNISEIKIDNVSYKPKGNVFSSNDEIIEIISNNADVVAYTNEIEDAGSTSIYVRNADAVEVSLAGEQEITDFNKDVRKKYVETSVVDEQMNLIKAADRGDISTEELDELIEIRKPKPEPALLETNIKFESVQVDDDTPRGYSYVQQNPRWSNEVIKPNKIFNPSKFETRYKRPDQTFKSGQEIVDAILSGTATDEDITRFFIFAASKSDGQAWGYGKKWSSADAIADIVKIGIFSDRNLKRVIPVDDSYLFSRMKDMMKMSGGYELPNEIFLDMANEQGQFTNLKERMRNVILDAHNKIYAKNPNDYFILWRGGNLSRFNTWQSFSKRQEAARGVMIQLKFSGVEQGGGMGTYVINKNNMIDLDALGLSHGREQEVIVLAEAANKPGAKLGNNITTPENLKTYTDNWALRARDPVFFPKQGFVIQNISQQLNQLGQPTQDFFTEVIQGMDKHAPLKAYEPIIQFENAQLDAAQDIYNKFVIQGGDFNQHIFTSIPTFYETQIVKAVALNNMLQNFEKQKKVTVLDIGATEGTWSKLLGSLNENLQIDVLEPNPAAEDIFNQTDQVENVRFQKNAFSYLPEDQGKFFLEEGGRRNIKFINFGAGEDVQFKYDVVHESMTFQFLDNNRKAQIDFIAENVLNDNGFLILEEKFSSDDVVYQANEELKNEFKKQYYSEAQINTKQHEVITSMGKNQVAVRDIENILNSKFKYVQQYWDAGNFKGYIASNNPLAETFVEEIYKTDVSLTGHEFSTNPTEQEIKFSVQKQMDNKFINKELAKELTKQTLESSKEFINKSSDAVQTIFKNVKSVGGVGLALGLKGLSKAAPVLEPGDVLIEKGIEKFSPQLNKAAQKLGFASLPVQKILPTYVALEIGIAAAEIVQASMYAYEASQEKAPGKPISNLQESLTRFLLPKSVEDEAIDRLRYKENVMRDFYNTPTGKAVLEEVDFGSQLLNQLGEERVARYSPGWNLSKAIFGLFGTIGTAISGEQANISEQTRDNMGQALLTGIGK